MAENRYDASDLRFVDIQEQLQKTAKVKRRQKLKRRIKILIFVLLALLIVAGITLAVLAIYHIIWDSPKRKRITIFKYPNILFSNLNNNNHYKNLS